MADILYKPSNISYFPPCNFDEKVTVLEDLKSSNPIAFNEAWSSISFSFTDEERNQQYVISETD